MTQEEAFEKLELENGASQQEIKQQYQEFYNEFQLRITNAPTTHQKALYQKKLKELEAAYELLTGTSTEAADADLPGMAPMEYRSPSPPPPTKTKSLTKEKALTLLGLKEPFTGKELEQQFEAKKGDCERGIQEAGIEAVKQAYTITLRDIIKAYQILIPLTKEDEVEVPQSIPKTKISPQPKPRVRPSIEERPKPKGKSVWIYLVPLLLLAVALYFWKPWEVKFTEEDRATYTHLKREADSIVLLGNIELALEKYLMTKEFIETLDPEIANEFTARGTVNDSISVLTEKLEWLNSLPMSIKELVTSMVYVEGGSFMMGCTDEQTNCDNNEKPVHEVALSSFSIGKHEITQAQWDAVMQGNPSWFKNCDQCPVESVTWKSAQRFISKLNELTGWQFRLPTEAEWEYAARGGQKSKGYKYSGGNDLDLVGWYKKNSGNKTHAVGQKEPNELGLYDMSGNVLEWCSDWYDENYYSVSPVNNPKGAEKPSTKWWWNLKVARGGRWDDINDCSVAFRTYDYEELSNLNKLIGFRVVVSN